MTANHLSRTHRRNRQSRFRWVDRPDQSPNRDGDHRRLRSDCEYRPNLQWRSHREPAVRDSPAISDRRHLDVVAGGTFCWSC